MISWIRLKNSHRSSIARQNGKFIYFSWDVHKQVYNSNSTACVQRHKQTWKKLFRQLHMPCRSVRTANETAVFPSMTESLFDHKSCVFKLRKKWRKSEEKETKNEGKKEKHQLELDGRNAKANEQITLIRLSDLRKPTYICMCLRYVCMYVRVPIDDMVWVLASLWAFHKSIGNILRRVRRFQFSSKLKSSRNFNIRNFLS